MNNSWDLKAIADAVKANVRQFGGFSPAEVKKAGVVGLEKLRGEVLKTLSEKPKTGFEIITTIGESSHKPAGSQLYPLLEQLVDEGLISATVKKDRRVFAVTTAGEEALKNWAPSDETDHEPAEANWYMPTWVDLRGELPKSLARLAKLSVEVSKHGTKEQQEQAAEAVEVATKQLHKILA
ncbi:MAG: PadR family transcriptional regulator [Rhodoluna sp.]|nr:PadR family transcriptional regulator [Rhodoluna sp.]